MSRGRGFASDGPAKWCHILENDLSVTFSTIFYLKKGLFLLGIPQKASLWLTPRALVPLKQKTRKRKTGNAMARFSIGAFLFGVPHSHYSMFQYFRMDARTFRCNGKNRVLLEFQKKRPVIVKNVLLNITFKGAKKDIYSEEKKKRFVYCKYIYISQFNIERKNCLVWCWRFR